MKYIKFQLMWLLVGFAICLSVQLSPEEKSETVESDDESDSEVEWTYSAKNIQLINDWKEQGYPGIPISQLPPQVVEKYGFDSDTIGPEIFYSNEVQNMMSQLFLSGEWNPEPFQLTEPGELNKEQESLVTSDSLGIQRGPDGLVEMLNIYAEHLGLDSTEELPEDIRLLIEHFHQEILEADEAVMRFEFEQIESYLLGLGHNSRIVAELPESHPNPSDDAKILPVDPLKVIAQSSGYRYNRDEGYAEYRRGKAPTYLFQSSVEKLTKETRLSGMIRFKPIPLDSTAGIAITTRLGPVDAAMLHADSNNYVNKQTDSISRFYSDTNFGGSLLIVEKEVESQGAFETNLTVAGNDALVIPFVYRDDSWTTNLYAFKQKTSYRIYADGKLEGEELNRFIQFGKNLVEYEPD